MALKWSDEVTEITAPIKGLESTLAHKPTWNRKGKFRFLSIRKWSSDHRLQTVELRTRKDLGDRGLVKFAAADISEALRQTLGECGGIAIIPAPRGHTGAGSKHFASEVAKVVARRVKGNFRLAFAPTPKRTKGVVTAIGEKSAVRLRALPPEPMVVLIDDVATTTTTLRTCAEALRPRSVLAVAWIYSDGIGSVPRTSALKWGKE